MTTSPTAAILIRPFIRNPSPSLPGHGGLLCLRG